MAFLLFPPGFVSISLSPLNLSTVRPGYVLFFPDLSPFFFSPRPPHCSFRILSGRGCRGRDPFVPSPRGRSDDSYIHLSFLGSRGRTSFFPPLFSSLRPGHRREALAGMSLSLCRRACAFFFFLSRRWWSLFPPSSSAFEQKWKALNAYTSFFCGKGGLSLPPSQERWHLPPFFFATSSHTDPFGSQARQHDRRRNLLPPPPN